MKQQQVKLEFSLKEKERRYSLLREKLKKEGLDALIVSGCALYGLGSPIHYLTQVWGSAEAGNALIFLVDGDPILLLPGTSGQPAARPNPWVPAANMYGSANLGADLAKHIIRLKLQKSRIGIDSLDFWPVQQYKAFTELCPDVQLVEARQMCSKIRAAKSNEELAFMEEAIRVQELAQRTFLSNLRSGLTELEVVGKVESVMTANEVGKHQFIFQIVSRPEEGGIHGPGNSLIEKSIALSFSPEYAMRRGYACQAQRMYCWEEPKGEYKRLFSLCSEIRRMMLKELRPGAEVTKVGAKIIELISEWGFQPPPRSLGHAIGIAYGEDPYMTSAPNQARHEEWTISPNEVYVIHPSITAKSGEPMLAWFGDMYLIGEDSTKWMTPFLPGLPEIIP